MHTQFGENPSSGVRRVALTSCPKFNVTRGCNSRNACRTRLISLHANIQVTLLVLACVQSLYILSILQYISKHIKQVTIDWIEDNKILKSSQGLNFPKFGGNWQSGSSDEYLALTTFKTDRVIPIHPHQTLFSGL